MKRLDDVLGYKNLHIFQDSNFFSFSLDSIILSNYSDIRLRDKKILDFCTGNGIVPLILSKRTKNKIIGVEIQEKLVELANESIKYNNLEEKIEIVNDDIKNYSKNHIEEYDLVLCNPPYFKMEEKNFLSESEEKRIARHEIKINLEEICNCAFKVLKNNGNFCLIHRTDRLLEVIDEFRKNKIEPKKIKFIYENTNKEASMFLIQGQQYGKVGLKVEEPLILYERDGSLTKEYKELQEEVRL